MTGQGYIDEVKLRLARLGVVTKLGDQFILTMANKARKEIQKATMSIFPERYGRIVNLNAANTDQDSTVIESYGNKDVTVNYFDLPADFIDAYVVLLKWGTNVSEARRLTKLELFNVGMHSWNVPTCYRPVYAVERYETAGAWNWRLYISDLTSAAGSTIDVWYVAAIEDIENVNSAGVDETEFVIPLDVEELVILYAIQYCLQNIQAGLHLQSLQAEIEMQENYIKQNYSIKENVMLDIPSKEGM